MILLGMDIDSPDLVTLKRGFLWQAAFKLDFADDQFLEAMYSFKEYSENGSTGIRQLPADENGFYVTELFAERLPRQVPMCIGAGIHSLRSALDTAVSAIVRESGGKPDTRVAFPVHASERDLRAAFESGLRTCPDCKATRVTKAPMDQIRKLIPDLERLILDVFKPWKDGNYPLWALNKLDNLQKHQTLLLIASTTSGTIDFDTVEGISNKFGLWRIQPGMTVEIARSRHQLLISNPPAVSCELLFPDNGPFGGQHALEVIGQLYRLVRGILLTLQAQFGEDQAALQPVKPPV